MLFDHVSQVGYVLIGLGEEVGQALVLLMVNHLSITLLIFSLGGGGGGFQIKCDRSLFFFTLAQFIQAFN